MSGGGFNTGNQPFAGNPFTAQAGYAPSYNWAAPPQGLPPNTTVNFPQMSGGPWNQLTQRMAGPSYSTQAPQATARPTFPGLGAGAFR